MVMLAHNPSLEELRQEEFQFKGSLSYLKKGGKGKEEEEEWKCVEGRDDERKL